MMFSRHAFLRSIIKNISEIEVSRGFFANQGIFMRESFQLLWVSRLGSVFNRSYPELEHCIFDWNKTRFRRA